MVHKLFGRDFFSSRDEIKISAKFTDIRGKLITKHCGGDHYFQYNF
jgi:hypothetical protein